jgi:hypothetical protein
MTRIVAFAVICFSLTACNAAVKQYVTGVSPPAAVAPTNLLATGPMVLKVSPGKVSSVGSSFALQATVTPTDRFLKSPNMSAQLSLHQQRVTP